MPTTASNCIGRDSLLSLLSLCDADRLVYAIEAMVLQEGLYLGPPQKIDEIPGARDVLGGPDGSDSVVYRRVRIHGGLIENTDLLIRYGVCPVDHAEVGFTLGDQIQDGSRMLAIDELRLQLGVELAVLEILCRHFSYRRGFRVADSDIPNQSGAKILDRRDRRRELRAGDQDQRGSGIDTSGALNDEPFLLELVDFLHLRRQEHIDRRTLFDLLAEGLRRPVDDSYIDVLIVRFEEREYFSKCILQAVGSRDGDGLRCRLHGRRGPHGRGQDTEEQQTSHKENS